MQSLLDYIPRLFLEERLCLRFLVHRKSLGTPVFEALPPVLITLIRRVRNSGV